MPRKVTVEVLERMRKLRGKGLTYQEIAGKTGLSHPTVANYMKKEGLRGRRGKRKRARITPEIFERMAGLRRRGLTYEEIARKLDVALKTVARHMREEGLGGRRRKVTGEVLKRMRDLRELGVHKKKIADKLNLSYETVLIYLKGEEGFFEKLKRKLSLK